MKKSVKFFLLAIIGLSFFTILIIFNFSLYEKSQPLSSVEDISLIVDYNNGTIKEKYNFTLEGGKTTAFDALDKWCDVEYEDYGWGIIIRIIDGVGGNWIYLVNNYSPGVGATVYNLNNSDTVKWERLV